MLVSRLSDAMLKDAQPEARPKAHHDANIAAAAPDARALARAQAGGAEEEMPPAPAGGEERVSEGAEEAAPPPPPPPAEAEMQPAAEAEEPPRMAPPPGEGAPLPAATPEGGAGAEAEPTGAAAAPLREASPPPESPSTMAHRVTPAAEDVASPRAAPPPASQSALIAVAPPESGTQAQMGGATAVDDTARDAAAQQPSGGDSQSGEPQEAEAEVPEAADASARAEPVAMGAASRCGALRSALRGAQLTRAAPQARCERACAAGGGTCTRSGATRIATATCRRCDSAAAGLAAAPRRTDAVLRACSCSHA